MAKKRRTSNVQRQRASAEALNRRICDANNSTAQVPCTTPVRTEGGPASPVADVNLAYRYLGNTYNFFNTRFGRDIFDGAGSAIVATVRACDPDFGACPMRNGFWNREQIVLGAGVPNADDFVGHDVVVIEDFLAVQDLAGGGADPEVFFDELVAFDEVASGESRDGGARPLW